MCREYKLSQFVEIMILQKLICRPELLTDIQRNSYKDSYASYRVSCICSRLSLAIFHDICALYCFGGFSLEGEGAVTFSYGNKNKQINKQLQGRTRTKVIVVHEKLN